jgi:hypothetical protein
MNISAPNSIVAAISFCLTIYGLVLSFAASWIVGVAGLLLPPLALIIGLCKLLSGVDLAIRLAHMVGR